MVEELKTIKLSDIHPSEYNPRKISQDELVKLEKSLENFGLVSPITINTKNNRIIGGHQRYNVLINKNPDTIAYVLELGDVGFVFTDTSLEIPDEVHEKLINLNLNKVRGSFDISKLNIIVDELEDVGLAEISGFNIPDLDENDYELEQRSKKKHKDKKPSKNELEKFEEAKSEANQQKMELIQNIESDGSHFVDKKQVYKIKNALIFCGTYNERESSYSMNNAFKELNLKGEDVHLVKVLNTDVDLYYSKDFDKIEEIIKCYPDEVLRVR